MESSACTILETPLDVRGTCGCRNSTMVAMMPAKEEEERKRKGRKYLRL